MADPTDRRSGERVLLYDTTLRDGAQREGMALSVGEKLRLVHLADALGVHVIEAGFPASNPKDAETFAALEQDPPRDAELAAFGMTRRRDVSAAEDPALRILADCHAPIVTLVGKTWDLHLDKVLRVDRDENLRIIEDSVAFLRAEGKRVFYDAEHFFDAYAADPGYALRCLTAAADAGAEWVIPCDTNGATLPTALAAAVRRVVQELGGRVGVGIHTHDDAGCGVANSLVAVEAGARQVQGTLNGYGERCGNANLVSIVPSLQLKLGYDCVAEDRLRRLTRLAHDAAEVANIAPDAHAPYVGRYAFGHKGGLHVAGVRSDARTFEHVAPETVGNTRHVLVSELSGRATVRELADEIGVQLDDPAVDRVLVRLKELEHQGYAFEAADASFELLVRSEAGEVEPLFTLESYRVEVERRGDAVADSEAVVRLRVAGERVVAVGEGNGPVAALDAALRSALGPHYPALAGVRLSDYTVRILAPAAGTAATTRVLVESTDGQAEWTTVGVSTNVVEASWEALVDGLVYAVRVRGAARPAAPAPSTL
jgi:2-isopropylmalate synthase